MYCHFLFKTECLDTFKTKRELYCGFLGLIELDRLWISLNGDCAVVGEPLAVDAQH